MLFESENSNEGMQAVLNELHTYVPYADIKNIQQSVVLMNRAWPLPTM